MAVQISSYHNRFKKLTMVFQNQKTLQSFHEFISNKQYLYKIEPTEITRNLFNLGHCHIQIQFINMSCTICII